MVQGIAAHSRVGDHHKKGSFSWALHYNLGGSSQRQLSRDRHCFCQPLCLCVQQVWFTLRSEQTPIPFSKIPLEPCADVGTWNACKIALICMLQPFHSIGTILYRHPFSAPKYTVFSLVIFGAPCGRTRQAQGTKLCQCCNVQIHTSFGRGPLNEYLNARHADRLSHLLRQPVSGDILEYILHQELDNTPGPRVDNGHLDY